MSKAQISKAQIPKSQTSKSLLAQIPQVERLLTHPDAQALIAQHGRSSVTTAVRQHLATLRAELTAMPADGTQTNVTVPDATLLLNQIGLRLAEAARTRLHAVHNLTGTVLHTNLGRSLLPEAAVEAVLQAMRSPVNLEFDLDEGGRGDRDNLIRPWITELTGAEDCTVVNNNAAAVLLTLNSLALRKQVVVSRGELVEIGGAFRIPDIMQRAGARLVEVGTTNRTHLPDFADAITPATAMLMKVHWSNYAISGFTAVVPEPELATLAHQHDLPFVVDLGSGTLTDLSVFGLPKEPTVQATLAQGADLVLFSGDKLLGGPQCGLIAGRRDLVARIRKNPLKRCLRVGKLTLAALEAVLRLYRHPEQLAAQVTTLRLLTRTREDIRAQVERLLPVVTAAVISQFRVQAIDLWGQIGSGALPVDLLPSAGLRLSPVAAGRAAGSSLNRLQERLRALPMPVVGYVRDGALHLDLRCLVDEAALVQQLPLWLGTPKH